MKQFSVYEKAAIKRTAQNVEKITSRRKKIQEQIETLTKEYNQLEEARRQWETPIINITGGYTTEELVDRVIEKGKPAKYVFKYPETIVPDVEITEEDSEELAEEIDENEKAPEVITADWQSEENLADLAADMQASVQIDMKKDNPVY